MNEVERLRAASRTQINARMIEERRLLENVEAPTKDSLKKTIRKHQQAMIRLGVPVSEHFAPSREPPPSIDPRIAKLQQECQDLQQLRRLRPPSVLSSSLIPVGCGLNLPHDNWRRILVSRGPSQAPPTQRVPEPILQLTNRISELEHQLQEKRAPKSQFTFRESAPHPLGQIKYANKVGWRYEPRADLTDDTHHRYRAKSCDPPMWVQSDQTRHSDLSKMMKNAPTVWKAESSAMFRPFATVPARSGEQQDPMLSSEELQLMRANKRRANAGSLSKYGDIRAVHGIKP